jgi:hypothetical protein
VIRLLAATNPTLTDEGAWTILVAARVNVNVLTPVWAEGVRESVERVLVPLRLRGGVEGVGHDFHHTSKE